MLFPAPLLLLVFGVYFFVFWRQLQTHLSGLTMTEIELSSPQAKVWLDRFAPPVQFSILACGVFLFFGCHNLLQEAMMNVPGFRFGVMLGYLEVLG